MEFQTDAQRKTYENVTQWMEKAFGELAEPDSERPTFGLRMGSAWTRIGVWPWGEEDATVQVRAFVVIGAEITPELMHYLLLENNKMIFGAFGIDDDDDIFFEHAILGSACTKAALKASVLAVTNTADQYDEKIVARWGGRRVTDPPTEVE